MTSTVWVMGSALPLELERSEMAYLTKVPVFDADDRAGSYMVPVYDEETEVINAVRVNGNHMAGIAGPNGAILCYVDDDGRFRGELRVHGETKAVCDAYDIEALARWLSSCSHNCKR